MIEWNVSVTSITLSCAKSFYLLNYPMKRCSITYDARVDEFEDLEW